MSWQTNACIISLRDVGRKLGINRLLASCLDNKGYETNYDNEFSATLKPGYCIWDVGANVGYYTRLFAQRVGCNGIVYAFEPSPTNFARLSDSCKALSNVRLLPVGLGCDNGKFSFQQGVDELGATSRVVDSLERGGSIVDIRQGLDLINKRDVLPPNAIKIDVEGFEHEVLEGLGEYLGEPVLRSIGIEVHFGILNERGMNQVPQQIERLLITHGFYVNWPDNSHLLAVRSGQ